MRIAICDDLPECREDTLAAVKSCLRGAEARVDLFHSGKAFLRAFQSRAYDLVFLDIEMPEMDGLTTAKHLRKLNKYVPIIFLTSHIEFAQDGYEVNALRYFTKPVDREKLKQVLSAVVEQLRNQRILWIKTDMGERKLFVKDILFLESQNQNVLVYTSTEAFSVRYNLKDYEKELAGDGFCRIHRGYLVSLAHIKFAGKDELMLTNSTRLPISRSYEKSLKEALSRYIQKEAL